MEPFFIIAMYSESHNSDMWYVERLIEQDGLPDYYGPFEFVHEAVEEKTRLINTHNGV
mgnify:CR=1 FL=1